MSQMYVVNKENGIAVSTMVESPLIGDVGQKGWTIQTLSAAGVDTTFLIAEEGADVFPLHNDVNEWFGYVVEGSGQLHLGDAEQVTERVNYQAGDVVIFKPDTYHGWKAVTGSKLMFVKPSL